MKSPPQLSLPLSEIAPYLDRAFELESPQLEQWLAGLETTQPQLVRDLRTLLAQREEVRSTAFLERPLLAAAGKEDLTGLRVGAYTIERLIGRGGMGEVWLASRSDGRFEGKCAIKFLDASITSARLTERFRREGRLLARLTHPNIARLLDAGATDEGRTYLALEYVDGARIDHYCAQLSIDERVRLFVDVVAAVAHAHTHLIIHRDLKPSNVLVTSDGQVKLLDFGIAKLMSADADGDAADLTRVEEAVMTPEYAAPEQLLGEPPSTATDVYQLGMLLYALLTDRHPIPPTGGHSDRIRAALVDNVSPASELVDGPHRKALKGDLDAILSMTLRRLPEERYATAQALQDELLRYLQREPVIARRGAAWYRIRKFIARHRVGVAASSVGIAGLCAALVFALVQGREATAQRDAARRELARATAAHDFTVFQLSAAAPGGSKFSVGELLEQSQALIEKQFADNPPLQAEMLATVGVQYMVSQRWSEATKVLRRAHEIAEATDDPVLKARTDCPFALLTILNGDGPAAETMMARALKELPQRPEYAQLRAECLTRFSEFGFFTGESAPMISNASQALALLDSASVASAARRIDAESALAYGYYLARDHGRAEEIFSSLVEQLAAAGMERTLAAADIFNNWSLLHYHSDIRKAEPLMRRTIQLRRSIEGPEGIAPTALFNHASVLLKLGRLKEAEPVYQEAIRTATERDELNTLYDATMESTEVYILSGQLAAAEAQLAKVLPYVGTRRFDMTRRAQLLYYQGRLAEARGNMADARARFAESVRQLDVIPQKTFISVEANCGLSRAELALAHNQAAADAAQRALSFAKSFAEPKSPSYLVGMALLEVGRAQRASGATDESIKSFRLARENLESTLGSEHFLTQQVSGLLTTP